MKQALEGEFLGISYFGTSFNMIEISAMLSLGSLPAKELAQSSLELEMELTNSELWNTPTKLSASGTIELSLTILHIPNFQG
jgi:hypothetical protein